MDKLLTIQQVAAATSLSVHTLRYYEKMNLITSIQRDKNGYRCYSIEDITWIEFLNRLKATGMTIKKMIELAELRRQGDSTLTARRKFLEEHYKEVQQHMIELQNNLNLLANKIVTYKEMENNYLNNRPNK
ncbi:MerR family transcriptional regulator [Paenibacillus pabuli]|uniref:MerR family transcriptional regulator n=1 Tax=Paenibacillus pabuli TaxID=1472 RepID=UPI000784FE81|nr:MerR family transcriptional regulator [Paenibacillus pabuli]MEC0128347.1 MerR family transcriptional regulator [Paenibacillus pabuli]